MITRLLGAAAMAAVVFATVPASAARMEGCSGSNLLKTETAVEAMPDGDAKWVAFKEMTDAQTALLDNKMGVCCPSDQGHACRHDEVGDHGRGRLLRSGRPFHHRYARLRLLGELAGEVSDGLRINLALVPLLDDREIRSPRRKILIALPAIAGEIVCR